MEGRNYNFIKPYLEYSCSKFLIFPNDMLQPGMTKDYMVLVIHRTGS